MQRLQDTRVILFGTGGVGSWCAEALVRSGLGHLTIVDFDVVNPSNVNRQDMATSLTIGQVKVDALKKRLLEINPQADITAIRDRFSAENAESFNLDSYNYIVDAIDSLKDKIALILAASASKATFFSSMGAALKMDPTMIRVAEFWDVRGCPLGAMLRKRMRQNKTLPAGKFLCVYDAQVLPNKGSLPEEGRTNGSLVHITGIFGFTLAGLILSDLCKG